MTREERVLYTDGDNVTVTDSVLHVRKRDYRLDGIIKHGLYVMRPSRLPAILLIVTGLILMAAGFSGWIPDDTVRDLYIGGTVIGVNTMALAVGGLIALIGVIAIGLLRDRYAVRIATAEGERNVVVSSKKEYITQIVDALSMSHYGPPEPAATL